jgi:hypothetical protein
LLARRERYGVYGMNFIGKWMLQDKIICDELIHFFNNSDYALKNKKSGGVINGNYAQNQIDVSYKNSTDLFFSPLEYNIPCIRNYLNQLQKICEKYTKKYPYCNNFSPWIISEGFNIQYYQPPSGGFTKWHTERVSSKSPNSTRHLVFMTYLNDVNDGGETEFYHQKIKIKPKRGLTVIWPADWTHVHRGIISPTEEKYIVTGWFNYV